MKSNTSSASFHPARVMNSWKGSMTASRNVRGAPCDSCGSSTISVIAAPGSMNNAVTTNTDDQGSKSERISASDPGTRLEIR